MGGFGGAFMYMYKHCKRVDDICYFFLEEREPFFEGGLYWKPQIIKEDVCYLCLLVESNFKFPFI